MMPSERPPWLAPWLAPGELHGWLQGSRSGALVAVHRALACALPYKSRRDVLWVGTLAAASVMQLVSRRMCV